MKFFSPRYLDIGRIVKELGMIKTMVTTARKIHIPCTLVDDIINVTLPDVTVITIIRSHIEIILHQKDVITYINFARDITTVQHRFFEDVFIIPL